ncbi:hypothetical protein SAMN00808754_1696 [Thermanaeromonas toyohensis ToBE]|uniref:Uncharacterized protein n=1 Tax=Thermanaeromonas toyohensis ToBE TaxID=698762 RepID=A0A1W1VU37_9FIRM|nr:hypothetical protein [Thermanaeromonas toyohensis]SMB96868.1 hypothetical protein SAMN00808754_1696 [Thermanaeromonas toyohensis ToBE]
METLGEQMLRERLDPRPDLKKDSWLWEVLLHYVYGTGLYWVLHGFRCAGTLLVVKDDGSVVMRPHIGPDGWENLEQYMDFREQHLVPRKEELERVLRDLATALAEYRKEKLRNTVPKEY